MGIMHKECTKCGSCKHHVLLFVGFLLGSFWVGFFVWIYLGKNKLNGKKMGLRVAGHRKGG